MGNNRILYIDYLKAIAMIFVIMGHINFANHDVKAWIYSFHMPVFFFSTGLVLDFTQTSRGGNLMIVARKYFKRLMLPFLLWGLIFSKFSIPNLLLICYGSYRSIHKAGSLTSLWFLPVMYVAVLLLFLISRTRGDNRDWLMFSLSIVALVLGVSMPCLGIGYPLSLNVALVALFFMTLGNITRPYFNQIYDFLKAEKKRGVSVCLLLILIFAGGSLTYLMNIPKIGYIHMGIGQFGNPILFALTAICGILMLIFLCIMLEYIHSRTTKGLLFVGQNTLCIFIVQKPIIGCFKKLFEIYPMNSGLVLFITTAGTLALSCILCIIINKYVPVLVGK
jgi:fucose 4-O-acetylase-like acetyltransferase